MPEIILKDVTKMYGKTAAVDHLSMVIPDHSFITLLGPSGCGKTTTLRMIAGLETPTYGEISIGGKVVFPQKKASTSRRKSAASGSCSRTTPCGPI